MQWGRNPQHSGTSAAAAQSPDRLLANLVYDPFVAVQQAENGGDLLAHYPAPLVDSGDVFMLFKTGQWISCSPPSSGNPAPCGANAWQSQIWNITRFSWRAGALAPEWTFQSDWKPEPNQGGLGNWEPVFQAALAGDSLYVPGAGGSLHRVGRSDGRLISTIDPFRGDPNTFVSGPVALDERGNAYYNALKLNPADPWGTDVEGGWLVKVAPDDSFLVADYQSLTRGAPPAKGLCNGTFASNTLPWPPSPNARPAQSPCGSQRPGVNITPAIAPDGTIYTVSRAHLNSRYGFIVAVNPDLSLRWAASLRDRLNDGCAVLLPPNGQPGGCREGSQTGVDPATNEAPAARVTDRSSSTPVVAPDGSVLYGAYTAYNYGRGHLVKFGPDGSFRGSYDFGWDTTPAVFPHDGTYSVILKDNHYGVGSYCGDPQFCPPVDEGPFSITRLSADLRPEWSFRSTNTLSCDRLADGSLSCRSDHPNGFEWCINAPAVDAEGKVYANGEDGNLYVISAEGTLVKNVFLNLAVGAAYTPLAIGDDGRIYTENDGHLFVLGSESGKPSSAPGRRGPRHPHPPPRR